MKLGGPRLLVGFQEEQTMKSRTIGELIYKREYKFNKKVNYLCHWYYIH